LNFELGGEQGIEISSANDHIAAKLGRRAALQLEGAAQFIKDLKREKRDLSFVIMAVIKKAITCDPMAGDALDGPHFGYRKIIRGASVVSEEIVSSRDVKVTNFHHCHDTIGDGTRERR